MGNDFRRGQQILFAAVGLCLFFLISCGSIESPVVSPLQDWDDSVGCPLSHRQDFFNPYYSWVTHSQDLPTALELDDYLVALHSEKLNDHQRALLVDIHLRIKEDLSTKFHTVQERLQYLAQLDLGEDSSETEWFSESWSRVYGLSLVESESCSPANPLVPIDLEVEEDPPSSYYNLYGQPRAWWGAMKTFATTYQSCNVLYRPALNQQDPPIQGLRYYGRHELGLSSLYTVADNAALVASHPYLKSWIPADDRICKNVLSDPLIYDFGGKPHIDPENPRELNFFVDAGTGSPALGLDCSGFVFSALGSVGLRLSSKMPIKANHVYGVNAAMLMSPETSGFDCLKPIDFHQLRVLEPGDIVASKDHVFMVDRVGEDPFGVSHLQSHQCHPNNMDYRRFDFDIVQSSAVKNQLGIHRMNVRDYLSRDRRMRLGLQDYALSLCHARFGRNPAPQRSKVSIVRSRGTKACMDKPLTLSYQSCVKGCFDAAEIFQKYY